MCNCMKPSNTIDINGVYNTTPMANVPQGCGFDDLLAFIVRGLRVGGYEDVRVEGDAIFYKKAPANVLLSAPGFYVNCNNQDVSTYVPLLQKTA